MNTCEACGHEYEPEPETHFCRHCGEHIATEPHGPDCGCDDCADEAALAAPDWMDDGF